MFRLPFSVRTSLVAEHLASGTVVLGSEVLGTGTGWDEDVDAEDLESCYLCGCGYEGKYDVDGEVRGCLSTMGRGAASMMNRVIWNFDACWPPGGLAVVIVGGQRGVRDGQGLTKGGMVVVMAGIVAVVLVVLLVGRLGMTALPPTPSTTAISPQLQLIQTMEDE